MTKERTWARKEFFGRDFPTSALIGVSALMPDGATVEAQGWAYLPADMKEKV